VNQRACLQVVGSVLVAAVVYGGSLGGCSGGGGAGPSPDGGGQDAARDTGSGSGGSSGSAGSGSGSSGGSSSSSSGSSGSTSSGSGSGGSISDGGPDAGEGFAASRAACVAKINALRASSTAIALQPYTLRDDATLDACVDTQAENDESRNQAHYSFENNAPSCSWADAALSTQSECMGYATTPAGIEQCIQDMWNESLRPNCAGCVGCTAPVGNCPNCDYYGTKGYYCGDYVNLSASDLTTVACGFAGSSPSGANWSVMNFE
jgi:hypothetical protein